MPTSSILHNIVISDPKKAEALANALEASSRDPKRKPSQSTISVLTGAEAVQEFLSHRESAGEEVYSDKNTKKILVVLGGGRPNGNTKQLVDAFSKGAADAGNQIRRFNCICLAIAFLDNFIQVKSFHRAFLLHCGRR